MDSMTNGAATNTRIVVVDRGWVFVGRVSESGDNVQIADARVIRRWGTGEGLGQLVGGPLKGTVLDHAGSVVVPKRAVIFMIVCTKDW